MARCDIEPNGIAKSCGTNEVSVKFRRGSRLFAGYRKDRKIIGLTLFGLRFLFFFIFRKKSGKSECTYLCCDRTKIWAHPNSKALCRPLAFSCTHCHSLARTKYEYPHSHKGLICTPSAQPCISWPTTAQDGLVRSSSLRSLRFETRKWERAAVPASG